MIPMTVALTIVLPLATVLAALPVSEVRAETAIGGLWEGDYVCAQGPTGLSLTIAPSSTPGQVAAVFFFFPTARNPGVPQGCFGMSGGFDPATGHLDLQAGRWLLQPFGFLTVDLAGTLDQSGTALHGTIHGFGCTTFDLRRSHTAFHPLPPACRPGDEIDAFLGGGQANPGGLTPP